MMSYHLMRIFVLHFHTLKNYIVYFRNINMKWHFYNKKCSSKIFKSYFAKNIWNQIKTYISSTMMECARIIFFHRFFAHLCFIYIPYSNLSYRIIIQKQYKSMLRLQTGYIYCKSEWETKKTFTHAYVYWSMLRAAMRPLNLKWIMYYDKKGSYKKE